MVTATKLSATTSAEADRLLVLWRREASHWCAQEMLDGLIDVADSLKGRGRRVPKREMRAMDAGISDPAELVVRALVTRGLARAVESYVEQLTIDRFRASNDWNQIGGPTHDDARDLFVARALDLKESDPEAFAALRAFGESLALASSLKDHKPTMKRMPARAAGSRSRSVSAVSISREEGAA